MIRDGYSLVRLADGAELEHYSANAAPPEKIIIREIGVAWDGVKAADVGRDLTAAAAGYRLVERWRPDPPPQWKIVTAQTTSFDGEKITVSVTLDDVPLADRKAAMKDAVMDLRDQKIEGGMTFNGKPFQSRTDDQTNVSGAVLQATMFEVGGGSPSSLRWHGGDSDFVWIAADNSLVPMDVTTVQNFGKAIAAHKSGTIFAARTLKDTIDAAADHAALDAIDITVGWPI